MLMFVVSLSLPSCLSSLAEDAEMVCAYIVIHAPHYWYAIERLAFFSSSLFRENQKNIKYIICASNKTWN